ncbi:MAG: hypothetical protein M3R35_06350 [Candidatus Eremiobacteraeota bacterium]|nr:hypothetical protein [Candidatus Eremiobacteraeota bacterium]
MNGIYKFIAGNSRATPIGLAIATILTLAFRERLGALSALIYVALLLTTLAVSTFEPIQ